MTWNPKHELVKQSAKIAKEKYPEGFNIKQLGECSKEVFGEYCEVCGEFVEGFEYIGCCSGRDCGCMGLPVEPCLCSTECWEKFKKGIKR